MRYLLTISYDGSNYLGWQKQASGLTIQGEIERVLSQILNQEIVIHGSGRTDAGVHAYGQRAHFDLNRQLDLKRFRYSLNRLLPEDIFIKEIETVGDDFHARLSAKAKHYEYVVINDERSPFARHFALFIGETLKLESLKENIAKFKGKHNFKNFTTKDEDEDNFVRVIYESKIEVDGNKIKFIFSGEGFMRAQIRLMVGALIAVNLGKVDSNYIDQNLDPSGERKTISEKAPGYGLYLLGVDY